MNDLERRLRDVLAEDGARAPLAGPMPADLRPEVRRRQAVTTAVTAFIAVLVVAGSVAAIQGLTAARQELPVTPPTPASVTGDTRPVFQRTATIGGLSITGPSDWVLVDYLGLWNADGVSLDSTAVPVLELTNFDPGLSTPVCDSPPGGPARLPADGVAILAMIGNGGVDDACGSDIEASTTGTLSWGGAVPYRFILAMGSNVSARDRTNAEASWRSLAWAASLSPYARGAPAQYVLDGYRDGGSWGLLEARPSRGGVLLTESDLSLSGSGATAFAYSSLPAGRAIYAKREAWFGIVDQRAAEVRFYRGRGGAPIVGRVVDLPPSLALPFDAWWFGPQLGQTWSGGAVAFDDTGDILGSTISPLVRSVPAGTLRAFGTTWKVKDSRSANGWHAQGCVEPPATPTSQPCELPLGGGLLVQTFSEPVPASFLVVAVGSGIRTEIQMPDGTILQPTRFPSWKDAAVDVFVLEGAGSGKLLYHYDNHGPRVYDGPTVRWPNQG